MCINIKYNYSLLKNIVGFCLGFFCCKGKYEVTDLSTVVYFPFKQNSFFSEDNPVYDPEGQMCCVIPFGFGSALSASRSPCLSTLAYPIKHQAPYHWDRLTTTAQSRAARSVRQTQVPSNAPPCVLVHIDTCPPGRSSIPPLFLQLNYNMCTWSVHMQQSHTSHMCIH